MAILSIQSAVALGHVGNSAAVFPLQRLGFEVWPVDTVQFSNHTGYDTWRGRAWDAATIGEVVAGIGERGVLGGCEALLSGYLGDPALGNVVLDAVAAVKAANPTALYCCDPVIGDDAKGVFVRSGVGEFLRDRALPAADIVTPNRFELAYLAGREVNGFDDALAAAEMLRQRGPRIVLATSLLGDPGEVAMLAASPSGAWRVATPRLPIVAHGAGDLTTALFLAYYLRSRDIAQALAKTANAVHAVLSETARRRQLEMTLVAAQQHFSDPPQHFTAQRIV